MTPAEAEALGRRWLAAGGGWRKGMRSLNGYRLISVIAPDIFIVSMEGSGEITKFIAMRRLTYGPEGIHKAGPGDRLPEWPDVPDLRDPATRGAALEVVRERLDSAMFHTDGLYVARVDGSRWEVWTDTHAYKWAAGASEAEALVAALEAAPKVTP